MMNYARIIIGIYGIKKIVLNKNIQKQTGFTLIEILIVVLLLGILATVIIPQVSVSSDDAKLNTLKTNLGHMRSVIELYYSQHGNRYPGTVGSSTIKEISKIEGQSGVTITEGGETDNDGKNESEVSKTFKNQLLLYTAEDGSVSEIKDATYKFGPYIIGGALPMNLFNGRNDVKCAIFTEDITFRSSDGTTGWKFYTKTGILIANDGANDNL